MNKLNINYLNVMDGVLFSVQLLELQLVSMKGIEFKSIEIACKFFIPI